MFTDIFIYPSNNPYPVLWYIYTLCGILILATILRDINFKKILYVLLVIIILNVKFDNNIFNVNSIMRYSFYFYLGFLFRVNYDKYLTIRNKGKILVVSMSILCLLNLGEYTTNNLIQNIIIIVMNILGIIACVNIAHLVSNLKIKKVFSVIADYSMEIYLFSILFQKIIEFIVLYIFNFNYFIVVILCFSIGFIPIIFSKVVLEKNKLLSFILCGKVILVKEELITNR